jgi:aspartyl-tRNA synthetase
MKGINSNNYFIIGMDIHRTHYLSDITESLIDTKVRITGWVENIRVLSKITFIIVSDISGSTQVVCNDIENIPKHSVISVSGIVKKSKAKLYPVEIVAEDIKVLAKAIHPLPLDPNANVNTSLDVRLDARPLDLRNKNSLAIFKIRHHALQAIREALIKHRFIEVNTPKIIGSASEGGANLFKLKYFDKDAYLAQSPQLYKEQLTLALDRVFEIAHYYRAEKSHTIRHLNEFVSVDIEAAFLDSNDVMQILENIIVYTISSLNNQVKKELETLDVKLNTPNTPFERLSYSQVIDELNRDIDIEFGDDLPDHALRLLGERHKGFYFIKDWPLKLKPFYIYPHDENKELSYSFDLQYGYLELASGGQREHDPNKLRARLIEQGLNPEDFKDHLRVFEWGMPPHSGWGLGFDRLLMVLTNSKNIREVVLYPRDTERLKP